MFEGQTISLLDRLESRWEEISAQVARMGAWVGTVHLDPSGRDASMTAFYLSVTRAVDGLEMVPPARDRSRISQKGLRRIRGSDCAHALGREAQPFGLTGSPGSMGCGVLVRRGVALQFPALGLPAGAGCGTSVLQPHVGMFIAPVAGCRSGSGRASWLSCPGGSQARKEDDCGGS